MADNQSPFARMLNERTSPPPSPFSRMLEERTGPVGRGAPVGPEDRGQGDDTGPDVSEINTAPLEAPPDITGELVTGAPIDSDTVSRRAADAGVEFEFGAPASIRATAAFAVDEREKVKALQANLQEFFVSNGDMDAGRRIEVRVGQETGRLEFFDPRSNRFRLVDAPGVDIGDFTSLSGDALVVIPEVAATIGVSVVTANPIAGISAGAAGAFAGEYARIKIGQRLGLNAELTEGDIITEAAKAAGLSVAGGTLSFGVTRLAKAVNNFLSGNPFTRDSLRIGADELDDAAEIAGNVNDVIRDGRMRFTTGQAADDPDLLSLQESFTKSRSFGGVQRFRAFTQEQDSALREYFKVINEPFESGIGGPFAAGRRVQAGVKARQEAARQASTERAETAQAGATDVLESLPKAEPESIGATVATTLRTARTEFTDWASTRAGLVNEAMGRQPFIKNQNVAVAANKLDKEVHDTLLAATGLKSAKKNLIGPRTEPDTASDAVKLLRETIAGEPQRAERLARLFDPKAKFTFDEYWTTAQDLDALIRVSAKGLTAETPRVGTLKFLRSALEKDAEAAFAGTPEGELFSRFRSAVRTGKDRFDRTVIGQVLETSEGAVKTQPSEVFDLIFRAPAEEIEQTMQVLRSTNPQAAQLMREALAEQYRRSVAPDGKVVPGKHKAFFNVRGMGRKVDAIFGEENAKALREPGRLQAVADAFAKRREETFKALDKTFSGRIENLAPQEIFRKIWMPANRTGPDPTEVVELMKILKRDPEALTAFRGEVLRDMGGRISSEQRFGTGGRILSFKKLNNYLFGNDLTGSTGHIEAIETLFGKKHADGVKVLHSALKIAQREGVAPNVSNTSTVANALSDLTRIWTGQFTSKGRAFTAAKRIAQRQSNRALMNAVLDPEKMLLMQELATLKPGTKRAAIILGQLGVHLLAGNIGPSFTAPFAGIEETPFSEPAAQP